MIKKQIVLGREIKISLVSQEELVKMSRQVEPDNTGSLTAWFDPDEDTIYIWSGLPPETFKRTLLHEIFHSMLSISGITKILEDKQEEAICVLAENLLELFVDDKLREVLK